MFDSLNYEGAELLKHLDKGETECLNKWLAEHTEACKMPYGAIGGRYTYHITPTGIGTVTSVSCACGEKKDVTDYDSW